MPFIYECSVSLFVKSQEPELLSRSLAVLSKTKFGISIKVPKVYLFLPADNYFASMLDIFQEFNDINDFLHIVSVVDLEDQSKYYEKFLLANDQLLRSKYISHGILCTVQNISKCSQLLDGLRYVKTLFYNNEITTGAYISDTQIQTDAYYKMVSEIFQLRNSLNYIPLTPHGILDILYCTNQMKHFKNNSADKTKVLMRLSRLFKNNFFEFREEIGSFEAVPPLLYGKKTMQYLAKNLISDPLNKKRRDINQVKVRSSMADYI